MAKTLIFEVRVYSKSIILSIDRFCSKEEAQKCLAFMMKNPSNSLLPASYFINPVYLYDTFEDKQKEDRQREFDLGEADLEFLAF